MPLDRKLHVCFSVFSRQAGWSRLELGIPLLPGKLGSGEVILLRADLKNRMLWHISKSFLSLSSCQKHDGISLHVYCENLGELQEVDLTKVWTATQ